VDTKTNQTILETTKTLDQPTVKELIDTLVKNGYNKKTATKAVYTEYKKGTLNLKHTHPPTNLKNYFISLENAWFWATTILVTTTLIVVFTINTSTLLYIRYVLGAIFVLFLPGYMLISALYTKNDEIDTLEKLALSIGLSLAIVPLIGLILNYTPWGIRLEPIMASLALFTQTMALTVVIRKHKYFSLNQTV